MNIKNKLADMPIRSLLYTMAVSLMLSLLVQSLYNIVDSMFVARLSETTLTATSLVYSIQFLMIAVGVGTAVGLNALLSRKIGQHKPEEACQTATTGLFLMLITSLIFSIAGIFFSDIIAAKLTPEQGLQELLQPYSLIVSKTLLSIMLQELSFQLAGCRRYLPRRTTDHYHAGNRKHHDLCCKQYTVECLYNSRGIFRSLL